MVISLNSRYKIVDKSSGVRHLLIIGKMIMTFLFSTIGCEKSQSDDLIFLRNAHIEVGILPEVGGRVVLLRKPGCENVLKADPRLWKDSAAQKPDISAFSAFKAFNGHIVWIGPQNEWWIHQDLNLYRRENKAVWPPDPYLIYGKFDVTAQNDTMIRMAGPKSPISGIRLYKEIAIDREGIVTFTATAENVRDENVSWDLWMNTRLRGFARCWVPIKENGVLDLVKQDDEKSEATPYKIMDGLFTYLPSIPKKPKKEQVQEAHLNPSAGFMVGIDREQMLVIRFAKLDSEVIHPNHGQVELYSFIDETGEEPLLELELHGAYRTLRPGEILSLAETWQVIRYSGNPIDEEQIEFICNVLRIW